MEFRRSGTSGGRRRRVLLEDTSSMKDMAPPSHQRSGTVTKYADAAQAECDVRLADLIPQRIWSLCLLCLLGIGVTSGLIWLHQQHQTWAVWLGLRPDTFSVLDLSSKSSLVCWVSSAVLAVAALTSMLIFRLRRHLVDDYRGRYRIWLWGGMLLLLMSAHCTASVESLVTDVATHLLGTTLWGDGYIWWVLVASVVALPMTLMVLIDMRHSVMASLTMLLGLGCYGASVGLRAEVLSGLHPILSTARVESMVIAAHLGHLMVLMSMWIFARYVLLGAQGNVSTDVRMERTNREKKEFASATAANSKKKSDAIVGSKKAKSRRSDLDKVSSYDGSIEANELTASEAVNGGGRKLSKAERRRLRKQARRQNKAA